MGTRLYRANDLDHYVAYDSELLEQHAHEITTTLLLPRMAKQATQALQTVKTPMFLFQRIRVGRRCSCFDIAASPTSQCRVCWGTGVVGGFNKWGTNLWVMDTTHPNVRSCNVIPDYTEQTTPRRFGLVAGTSRGYVEARFYPETNIGKIDATLTLAEIPPGGDIQAFIRAPGDTSWIDFTNAAMEQRLTNKWIDVRFTLERPAPSAPSPMLAALYFRYRRQQDCTLLVDVPRNENSIMLGELGVVDDWRTKKMFVDNKLRTLTTEDFFAELAAPDRWKVISVNEYAPEKLLIFWDLDARVIHQYEAVNQIPLGT
jgi:hypothetical protein